MKKENVNQQADGFEKNPVNDSNSEPKKKKRTFGVSQGVHRRIMMDQLERRLNSPEYMQNLFRNLSSKK